MTHETRVKLNQVERLLQECETELGAEVVSLSKQCKDPTFALMEKGSVAAALGAVAAARKLMEAV